MDQIENYVIVPIGNAKNLSGTCNGDFEILYRTMPPPTTSSQQAFWLCKCKHCQQYFVKSLTFLKKESRECECQNNLVNKTFGRWTVLSLCEQRTAKRGKIYHCKCECGNEKNVPAETLRRGESRSCGCLQKEIVAQMAIKQRLDLTGERFGKLVAIYPIYSGNKNKHTKWHCKCDCGNECDIDMGNLRQGFSKSCGCTASRQEEKIIKLLRKENISFQYQYKFNNFLTKDFDFFVENKYIIEFDGQQHFLFTGTGWDTKEHFERTRKSDKEKNRYCFDNNIPLIRIPYDTDYTLNDLKLETTRFLLTPETEEEYYLIRK